MNLVTICTVTGTVRCWSAEPGKTPLKLAEVYIPNWLEYSLGREHIDRFKIQAFRMHPEIFCPPKKEVQT